MIRSILLATAALVSLGGAADAQQVEVQTAPGFADFIAVDGDGIWVTNRGRVEHWSRKGKLGEVPLARPCGAMAIMGDALWVANCGDGTLARIDRASAKLAATIPTGIANQKEGELNVVAGAGSIWLASDAKGVVSRIDPATNKVIATIAVDPATTYLAYGLDAVWAASPQSQMLQRIDPKTNKVTGKVALGRGPGFLAAGEGAVWIQEQVDGTLVKVDPQTMAIAGRLKLGANLKWGDIDTGAGKVWLRTTDDQVFVVVDAATMAVDARLGKAAGSGALRFTQDGIWTSAHDEHTLSWWPKQDWKAVAAKP